jgi:hypothetical protein
MGGTKFGLVSVATCFAWTSCVNRDRMAQLALGLAEFVHWSWFTSALRMARAAILLT